MSDKTSTVGFMVEFPKAGEVVSCLRYIKQHEAATYIRDTGRNLKSFVDTDSLIEMFKWSQTRFGHQFWEDIYWELLSMGYEQVSEYITDLPGSDEVSESKEAEADEEAIVGK